MTSAAASRQAPKDEDEDTGNDSPENEPSQHQEEKDSINRAQNDFSEAHRTLAEYMEEQEGSSTTSCPNPKASWERVFCCNSSRYLYCEICCKMLIPTKDIVPVSELQKLPGYDSSCKKIATKPMADESSQSKALLLPFNVHILVDDRRASSTGIQVRSIFRAFQEHQVQKNDQDEKTEVLSQKIKSSNNNNKQHSVEIFDIERDEIPSYHNDTNNGNNNHPKEETYLLFPGENSVPLSSVLNDDNKRISTLVVLDCKWARSNSRLLRHYDASWSTLQQVSLDEPPTTSYYWRWHNTGPGMVSTVEAIYYASWQITTSLGWTIQERKHKLIQLLWLFRLQRNIIHKKYQKGLVKGTNPHVPFTEEAKDFARQLRRKQQKKKKRSNSNTTKSNIDQQ